MTDLIVLQAKFWNFRHMMAPHWFIPETLDAARFAVTEAAEVLKTNGMWEAFVAFAASRQAQITAADALDAALRRNASYSRNTVRNMDEINELGDLAMMLLTAIGEEPLTPEEITNRAEWEKEFGNDPKRILDDIVYATGCVHIAAYRWLTQEDVRSYAVFALSLIDRYPGMDLAIVLHSRMARIYRKHHPDAAGISFPVSEDETTNNEVVTYTDRNERLVLGKATPATYTILSGGII